MPVVIGPGVAVDDPAGTPLIGYNNLVTPAGVTSITELPGFPVTNVANPATHLVWKAAFNTGNEVVTIVPSAATVINYIGIAKHNLGSTLTPFIITDAGSSPPVTLVPSTVLVDDNPAIIRFVPGIYSQLKITFDLSAVPDDGIPNIAVIYAGNLLVLERGIKVDVAHVPLPFGRRTSVINGMSETGNFLGRIVLSESRQSQAQFFAFNPTFYRNSIDPFLIVAKEFPFFWAWAPTDYPLETGFAWLTSDAVPEQSPDHRRVALTLSMAGIA